MSGLTIGSHLQKIYKDFLDIQQYRRPGIEPINLSSEDKLTIRKPWFSREGKPDFKLYIHYDLIASGNKVIISATERDRLRA